MTEEKSKANARGEVKFQLGNKTYIGRLTFKEMLGLESELDLTIMELSIKFMNASFGVVHVVNVLYSALKGHGDDSLTYDEIGEKVVEAGIINYTEACTMLLSVAMTGGEETSGNSNASPKEK